MNIHSIFPLLASLTFLFFSLFVFFKNPRSIKNSTYSLMCFCTFIWEFSMYILLTFGTNATAIYLAKMVYVGVIFIPITYFHFICAYLEKKKMSFFLVIGYMVSVIFVFSLWMTDNFISGYYEYSWGYYPKAGPIHEFFLVLAVVVIAATVFLVLKNLRTNRTNFKIYNRDKYLLIGGLFYASAFIDFLPNYGFSSYPIGFIPIIISMLIMTYAIVKHNLLNINVVIKKGLVYSILITAITIFYVAFALLIENQFRSLVGYKSLPLTIFTITLLVLFFQPLKNYIQRIIDKYFFHGSIDQIDEENIKLRDELQKSEKLKAIAALAAGMAHEIKNPLTSIKTFTEYIPKKKTDPEFLEKFQKIVGGEVDRINYIVKQLLEFSKPSELHLKETGINDLLDETLSLLNNDFLKHNIKIEKHYSLLPPTKVDPSQMKQVFLNLFLNAIDSMQNDGVITVTTKPDKNDNVTIKIEDTGKGISKEDLKHIFDPFFSKKDGGTGLGLSVVHGIIEKHGGKISVESAPEHGTSFKIGLPVK